MDVLDNFWVSGATVSTTTFHDSGVETVDSSEWDLHTNYNMANYCILKDYADILVPFLLPTYLRNIYYLEFFFQ